MADTHPSPVATAWRRYRSHEDLAGRAALTFRERYAGEAAAFARKMAEEARELAREPTRLVECADVLICMLGYLDAAGVTWDQLLVEAHDKMDVNEHREWNRRDDGTWQHVEGSG